WTKIRKIKLQQSLTQSQTKNQINPPRINQKLKRIEETCKWIKNQPESALDDESGGTNYRKEQGKRDRIPRSKKKTIEEEGRSASE
ncbi:predicted protein, partial [Arabidopsis lyrata subsp. lyrata]